MINQDVIDLYNRVQGGEKVVVLNPDGSYPTRLVLPPPAPKPKKPEPVVVPAAMPAFNPMLQGVPPGLQAPAVQTPVAPAPALAPAPATANNG